MCNCGLYYTCNCKTKKRHYGVFHFLWDMFMVCLTGGLWLIYIIIREVRNA